MEAGGKAPGVFICPSNKLRAYFITSSSQLDTIIIPFGLEIKRLIFILFRRQTGFKVCGNSLFDILKTICEDNICVLVMIGYGCERFYKF